MLYHKKVTDFVYKRVSNRDIAEDLTSEIFEKILKSINDFQWQGITLSAWIFRIARNHIIDYYRKNNKYKNDKSLEDVANYIVSNAPNIEIDIQADQDDQQVYKALMDLSAEDQYLVYYKFFEELSNKDISKITKISETNIGTKLHRIRKKLKNIIEKIEKNESN